MEKIDIPGFDLERELGRGATGVVYAARDRHAGRPVAIKVIGGPGLGLGDGSLAARARQEAAFSWSLNHQNVVRVHTWGELADRRVYIVMEWLHGRTSAERLLTSGRVSPEDAGWIVAGVAMGLSAVHARGAIHRDVKPENVFETADGPVKLLDLGIARLAGDDPARQVETRAGLVLGTPGYIAPEQAFGRALDARADLYGLGATWFTLLTGAPPHHAPDPVQMVHAAAFAQAPPDIPDHVPPGHREVLRAMLDPDPDRRPINALDVLDRLHRLGIGPGGGRAETEGLLQSTHLATTLLGPRFGTLVDRAGFRQEVVAWLGRLYPTGALSGSVAEAAAAVEALYTRWTEGRVKARRARSQADDEARRLLAARAEAMQVRDGARENQQSAVSRSLASALAVVQAAERLGDSDRARFEAFRQLRLDGGLGRSDQAAHLAELARIDQVRAERVEDLGLARANARRHRRMADGAGARLAEADAALARLDRLRETVLADLDDEARRLEDDWADVELALDHGYLQLGIALHRAQHSP